MSERLRQLLDETEALQNYGALKSEHEELEEQNRQLKQENGFFKSLEKAFPDKKVTLEDIETHVRKTYFDVIQQESDTKATEKFDAVKAPLTVDLLKRELNLPPGERMEQLQKLLTVEIQKGVKKGLDNIFWAQVNSAIETTKTQQWNPYLTNWLQTDATPAFRSILSENLFSRIIGLNVTLPPCKNCGVQWIKQLTHEAIAYFSQTGAVTYDCGTPKCIEGIVFRHPTHIVLSLGEAVAMIVGVPAQPGAPDSTAYMIKAVPIPSDQLTTMGVGADSSSNKNPKKKALTPKYSHDS